VATNAYEGTTRTPEEQEKDHEKGGADCTPYGGEKKVTGPVIDGTGRLILILVEHRNEHCRNCQLYEAVSGGSDRPEGVHVTHLDEVEEGEDA